MRGRPTGRLWPVRVGIALPQYGVDQASGGPASFPVALGLARHAEQHGLDSVWLSDHPFAVGPDGTVSGAFEPVVAMTSIARATDRIRIGTLVLAGTMRAPAMLAHAAGGLPAERTVIGVGTGWYAPEHRAFGLEMGSYTDRAARLERSVVALASLPEPRPRILVGGWGPRVLEIAGRHADQWNVAWDVPPDGFASLSARLDDACRRAGRDPRAVERSVGLTVLLAADDRERDAAVERLRRRAPFLANVDGATLATTILVGSSHECIDRIAAYQADEVVVAPLLRDDAEMIERLAAEVVPALRS